MSQKKTRVALVGDHGVGKSSIIIACSANIVRESTQDALPKLPETKISIRGYAGVCIDTSASDIAETKNVVRGADVILVCFSSDDHRTLDSALAFWLPLVSNCNREAPVILVACKQDSQELSQEQRSRMDGASSKMDSLVAVTACSTRIKDSATALFQRACEAHVHPLKPLYNHVTLHLRSKAIRAFKRIFQLCDKDGNGAMDDSELQAFQLLCYGHPFSPEDLEGLKQVIMESIPQGVTTEGLTLPGFLQLQTLTIMRERLDICWNMLRQFGYTDAVELDDDLCKMAPSFMSTSHVAQLSTEAIVFLIKCFNMHVEFDGFLPLSALLTNTPGSMFHSAPKPPLDENLVRGCMTATGAPGRLTLDGFLALWAYCTLVDPRKAVKAMLYACYPDNMSEGGRSVVGTTATDKLLVCTLQKQHHVLPPAQAAPGRQPFRCLVFGSTGCGKTTLLKRCAGHQALPGTVFQQGGTNVSASLVPAGPQNRPSVLVMIEVPDAHAQRVVVNPQIEDDSRTRLACTEVAAFAFDCTDAASYHNARTMLIAYSDTTHNCVPAAFIALKSDLGMSTELSAEVTKDCKTLGLAPPFYAEAQQADCSNMLQQLVNVAINPEANCAVTPAVAAARKKRALAWQSVKYAAVVAVATATIAVVANGALSYKRRHSESDASDMQAAGQGNTGKSQHTNGATPSSSSLRGVVGSLVTAVPLTNKVMGWFTTSK